ncbi:DUF4270 domain-containing protein [Aquimarina sp. 2201CG1-2-11]|uniref:DUF4270 domain-containing protein n=1 Tax=Aquimarina discodermiae TaxID=3231043 RepID=UPI0034630DC7
MKFKNVLSKAISIVAVVFVIVSCDNDFDSVGNEVLGGVNFEKDVYTCSPVAHSRKFERVQTSNMPGNLIGVYNDPFYGQSIYSVLSQVALERYNPDFGENATLTSVVLNLPYHSTETSTSSDEVKTYSLDSVYGSTPIKLSIYKSNYFLRDFDPESGSGERQLYYSNLISQVDENEIITGDSPLYTISDFVPSSVSVEPVVPRNDSKVDDKEVDSLQLTPRLRIPLPIDVFKTNILDMQGKPELDNANSFRNFFRGIYFKTELADGANDGNMFFFDMSQADITLRYTYDKEVIEDNVTTTVNTNGEFKINFSNNIINTIEQDPSTGTVEAGELDANNEGLIDADKNLYIRGGNGFVGTLDFFNNYVEVDSNGDYVLDENENPVIIENPSEEEKKKTELDFLKDANWLVNDAIITLFIDDSKVLGGDTEPERIYIYNLETGSILIDYALDSTRNENEKDVINSMIIHLGRISRDSNKKGEFYQIRITKHIIDVLNGDQDNVKLGISVSSNVNNSTIANGIVLEKDENDVVSENDEVIPFSSIISHEGTVFYGYGSEVPDSKRLKLDIFYTKSKN